MAEATPVALVRVLLDAERFYRGRLAGSGAPAYLETRGFSPAATKRWPIGYAPAGWTTLIDHLRHLGYDDALIEAAGLARRSSRGTLIDHFRDRVMLAIRDERGMIAGFIGRARPVPARPCRSTSTARRPGPTARVLSCSACTRHVTSLPAAPFRSSWKARSTLSQ